MSLISLLIALAAERHLSSPVWQFRTYYNHYIKWLSGVDSKQAAWQSVLTVTAVVLLPTVLVYFLLWMIDDSILHLIASTLILIVCFGCIKSRDCYKSFLLAAFRGELTSCDMFRQQLMQDKNLPDQGIGQMLIWLNYRYYIAIMLFFVIFGAPGVVFYRLLVTVAEKQEIEEQELAEQVANHSRKVLDIVDWLPVRIASFGYMFVGHFSKALSTWLESLFEFDKSPNAILVDVAQKSEDFMVDEEDCTAEPCLLVRLAKRNVLLFLSVIAILTMIGFLN